MSRLEAAIATIVIPIDRPFSNFLFAEQNFEGSYPIRRLFSEARSRTCRTLVIEDVPATGVVADENDEIVRLWPDYKPAELKRLSFWKAPFTDIEAVRSIPPEHCFGYAILKHDRLLPRLDRWTIFEAVLSKYEHHHNYIPCGKPFRFLCGVTEFAVRGALYCQQNLLNKACAQVALRSACATYLGDPDVSYSKINSLAFEDGDDFTPWKGFDTPQVPRVLNGLGIPFFDFNYHANSEFRDSFPYQRLLYSGVESGTGGLVAFSMSGPGAGDVAHMIPVFGHTFNEDAWAPHAEGDYFNIGNSISYVPSDSWLTSFVVHDDNYGSDLCVPKGFLRRENAEYAVAFLPRGFGYNGLFAEFAASNYFYSLLPKLVKEENLWLKRLVAYCGKQKLILRVLPVTKSAYIDHLRTVQDWEFHVENPSTLTQLATIKPEKMWIIEVSLPDLFSTNLRKVGEVLLDATRPFSPKPDFDLFVMARFPEVYLFFEKMGSDGQPSFVRVPSDLQSHTELLVAR
jgi:hypothetical protein